MLCVPTVPSGPKESDRFPKIGATDGYDGEGAGNRTWSSARAAKPSLAPGERRWIVCELSLLSSLNQPE